MHILELLDPLYEVDFLLPRTILACLGHRHMENVMKYCKMPVEAILAMLFFHLKAKGIYSVQIKVSISHLDINLTKVTLSGYPRHRENRENGKKKIPVMENTGNLEILSKHREFCLLKL